MIGQAVRVHTTRARPGHACSVGRGAGAQAGEPTRAPGIPRQVPPGPLGRLAGPGPPQAEPRRQADTDSGRPGRTAP